MNSSLPEHPPQHQVRQKAVCQRIYSQPCGFVLTDRQLHDLTSAVGSSRARKTQFTRIRPTTAESNHGRDTTCFAHPRHRQVAMSACFDAVPGRPCGSMASPPDWCFAVISMPKSVGYGLTVCATASPLEHRHTCPTHTRFGPIGKSKHEPASGRRKQ